MAAELKQNIETVNHLKKKLDKGVSFEKTMHILYKLQKIPISIKLLEATGIGLKIRELSKAEKANDIGKTAKLLTMTWKDFVRNQPADDDDDEEEVYRNESLEEAEISQDSAEQSPPPAAQKRHSKHSKKSSSHHHHHHHHRGDKERDHHSHHHHHKENGHKTHRKDSVSDGEESSPPETSTTTSSSSKHKEKKKHKHHHKEKKSKHHKSKSNRSSDDNSEDEEDNEGMDSTDEAAAELFGAVAPTSTFSRKEQRKAEKKEEKHRRRREEKRMNQSRESSLELPGASSVKRLRIKEPVDPNANSSKSNGLQKSGTGSSSSQRELTVENGADLFNQMLSSSSGQSSHSTSNNNNSSKQLQTNGYKPTTSTATFSHSSSQNFNSNSRNHSSNHHPHQHSSSSSSRHPSSSQTSTSSQPSNSRPHQSSSSSRQASQALDMLASMNGINRNTSKGSSFSGPDPNYRPSMHRRLDEMMMEASASARARAPPLPPPPPPIHHQSAAAADAHERANTAGMKLFKGRTAVWSGASKAVTVAQVYPLQELCIRLLMNHLDMIFEVGDLPYYLLKPVLVKCSVAQLRRIENYNPQLLDETDELWNEFVQKEFKTPLKPEQFDSWRQYYNFQLAQREHRLKVITAGISSKARKAVPERKTVTIDVKLPREIRRRQERASNPFYSSGGGGSSSGQGRGGSSSYSSNSSGGLGGTAPHSMGGSSNLGGMVTLGANKPKTAPLMKKLLQIRKGKGGFKR